MRITVSLLSRYSLYGTASSAYLMKAVPLPFVHFLQAQAAPSALSMLRFARRMRNLICTRRSLIHEKPGGLLKNQKAWQAMLHVTISPGRQKDLRRHKPLPVP